jgi:hypothetical protein
MDQTEIAVAPALPQEMVNEWKTGDGVAGFLLRVARESDAPDWEARPAQASICSIFPDRFQCAR